MTWEGWYTLGVIVFVFIALLRNWGPIDGVILGGTLLVGAAGIVSPAEAFSGFVNEGTLTIGALFIVAAAMRETGALDSVAGWTFGSARTERAGLVRMAVPVSTMSAFVNNTPIVAMLLPAVNDWCRKHDVSPSKMLLPLSFIAILGGTCTLIGTSTNLAINGLVIQEGVVEELSLFEFAYLGVPFVVVGILYIILVGQRLLPEREDIAEAVEAHPREYLADMQVLPGCRLIGQSIDEAGLRQLPGLFLMEIARGDRIIAPVGPEEVIREDDILTFAGVVSTIVDLERIAGLVPVADEGYERRAAERRGKNLVEAVVSQRSPHIGSTIRAADFRARYGAAVIAVHRGGERIKGRIGDIVLEAGDTLLLQAGRRFVRLHHNNPDFYLVSAVEESRAVRHDRAPICLALIALLVILIVTDTLPVVYSAFVVAGLMVFTRCLPVDAARKSVDWQTLITIGAAFGLGEALENSGASHAITRNLETVSSGAGVYGGVLVLYVLTGVVAALVSSKAAAVLMFPIAVDLAAAMEIEPKPYIMAIAYAAAATLATPLGYPTNLMVYGPGGYKFTDFLRVGIPLTVILAVLATVLIPIIWPAHAGGP